MTTAMLTTAAPRRSTMPSFVPLWIMMALGCGIAITLLIVSTELRHVLAPLLTMVFMTTLYGVVLHARDGHHPVFEPASLCVAATFIYAGFPLLNFIAGDLRWHAYSDPRLVKYDPGAAEVGLFGWRYALYLSCLVITYLIVRGRKAVHGFRIDPPGTSRVVTIITLFLVITVFLGALWIGYGVELNPAYSEVYSGEAKTMMALPRVVLQVAHNAIAIRLFLEQLFIAVLILHWRYWSARIVLVLFLALVAFSNLGGARTELVLLIVTTMLLYHRLVAHLRLRIIIPFGAALMAVFLTLGIIRDMSSEGGVEASGTPVLAASNEFQVLFANAYDLHQRRYVTGELPPIPWQIYWADFTALVPSQLLPFEKIDPSMWYMYVLDASDSGVGLMFGLLAQTTLGADWIELAARGIVLGLILALLQRWYVKRQTRFWPTMFMLFLTVWTFYTIRQSTFAFLYFIVYRFIPAVIAVEVFRQILIVPRRLRRARRLQTAS